MKARVFDAMKHQVHRTDAQHGHAGIAVVGGDRFVLEELVLSFAEFVADKWMWVTFLVVFEDFGISVRLKNVLVEIHRKPACARRWVAHFFPRLRIEHFDHHSDDMPWSSELPACSSSV